MQKKDIGSRGVWCSWSSAVVALINPRFLSPINLANTANLIGLVRHVLRSPRPFVIVTAGYRAVRRIGDRPARRHFCRSHRCPAKCRGRSRSSSFSILGGDHRCDPARLAGHQAQAAAVHRHAMRAAHLSRHRALLHRRRNRRILLRRRFSDTGVAGLRAHRRRAAFDRRLRHLSRWSPGSCCTGRSSGGICSPSARMRKRRAMHGYQHHPRDRARLCHLRHS